MRILVVTCAHRGDDARIAHRQIAALIAAGHEIVLIAPEPKPFDRSGFDHRVIPRAVGRRRWRSWWSARRAAAGVEAEVLIVHDLELVPIFARNRAVRIWDVHEDFVAVVDERAWLPAALRRPARWLVRIVQRAASRRYRITLAEESYMSTFPGGSVVPNTTIVPQSPPPPGAAIRRAIYLGRISTSRGLSEMVEVGHRLRGKVAVELVGAVDAADRAHLEAAVAAGDVKWTGYLPNDRAVAHLDGALVGLSLLRDEPNFRHSMPTKIIEYLAHGVPVISTPLPVAADLIGQSGGFIVGFGDVAATVRAVERLAADPLLREELGHRGHAHVRAHHDWGRDADEFVAFVERVAALAR